MEKNEISLADLFMSLRRHIVIILVVTLLFGLGSFVFTRFFITPKYTATAKLITISNAERTNDIYTSAEHNAAVALVNTTAEVIKTTSILDEASDRLALDGRNYSAATLKKMITISSENETEIFRLNVTGTRQADVALIANVISAVTEERIGEYIGAGKAILLEEAQPPAGPSSPSITRNTILGALAGFVLVALFVILRDLFDTKIWTEEDLTSHFKYPVLGMVPQLSEDTTETTAKEGK